jgi:L-ascorbate metabolism protein UlaG (beta-lactamase superfamily)
MLKPFQQNEALVADFESVETTESLAIWWLGQSGFLIKYGKESILFDPYLSDSLPKKYAGTNKPHTRISEIVVDPNLLKNIDIVTSSHNHTDHLDAETLQPILANNPEIKFIIPEANRHFVAERVQCDTDFPIGMNDGSVFKSGSFEIHGIPAAHNEIDRNEVGQCKYMGFVLKIGKYALYHSGDTLLYDGLISILKPFQIDLAFLPINGNVANRGVAGNLNCSEAALVAAEIGAKLAIPHHYDMFEFNTANPADFANECIRLNVNYKILALGEKIIFT